MRFHLPAQDGLDDAGLAVGYVRELQRDGRLLLRYVARHVERPLGQPGMDSWQGASGDARPDPHVLTARPEDICDDGARLEELAMLVDNLARRAAPASVTSIRLTAAYLRVPVEGLEPPEGVRARARRLKRLMGWIVFIAAATTLVSVLLLAHVDSGQRSIQQLETIRGSLADLAGRLSELPPDAWVSDTGGDNPAGAARGGDQGFCPLPTNGQGPAAGRVPADSPRGDRAQALCSQRSEAALRQALVFRQLTDWNRRTENLYGLLRGVVMVPAGLADHVVRAACHSLLPAYCTGQPPRRADPWGSEDWFGKSLIDHWGRTELRTSSSISLLTGFVLPLMLGCVGGCAYALRRLDQRLSSWTLELRDGSHSLLRVLLATMLGGLVGVVWTGGTPVQLGGFTLTLAAVAFFVGFSLEVVFSVIETMVEAVAGKLRAQPSAPIVLPLLSRDERKVVKPDRGGLPTG